MYVVIESGHKLEVVGGKTDNDKEYNPFIQRVDLYADCTILRDIQVFELSKSNYQELSGWNYELEFIKELRYDHEPTKEEILWAMSAYGLTLNDVAIVRKAYELDMEYDDQMF